MTLHRKSKPPNSKRWFCTQHTAQVGENYFEHAMVSLKMAGKLFVLSLAAFIHAVLPWVFQFTVTSNLIKLGERARRRIQSGLF